MTCGKIKQCSSPHCNFKCCDFDKKNYILLFPGELEKAKNNNKNINHLKITGGDNWNGHKAICTAKDKQNCDKNYKPIDCQFYPFFPVLKNNDITLKKGSKCPLKISVIKNHADFVFDELKDIIFNNRGIIQWLNKYELVDYEYTDISKPQSYFLKKTLIALDDTQPIIDGIEYFLKSQMIDITIKKIKPNIENENPKSIAIEILSEIKGPTYLLLGYKFNKVTENKGDYYFDDSITNTIESVEVIENLIAKIDSYKKKYIKGILIYSNELDNIFDFYFLLKQKLTLLREGLETPNSYLINTSTQFNRPQELGINMSKSTTCIGADSNLKAYGQMLGAYAKELINRSEGKQYGYGLDLNSLRFSKFHSIVNNNYLKDWKIGSVSFLADEIDEYLLDIPYKHYNELVNKIILDEKLNRIFHVEENITKKYKKGCHFYYLSYNVDDDSLKVSNLSAYKYNPGELLNKVNGDEKKLILKWMPILHSAVFYLGDFVPTKRAEWDSLISSSDRTSITTNVSKYEIFWFMHSMELDKEGIHGLLNYTFFREISNRQSLENSEIINNGEQFYFDRRPLIVAKSKEALIKYFSNNILKHASRSAIAVIMARNLSHTDGSHVMVDFENSMVKDNFNYEQFKLYNQHLRNTMELVADVSGKIGIQSNYEYCLKNFFEDLENNYFSNICYKVDELCNKIIDENGNFIEEKIKGNFLGTGLNDGKAHSVIEHTIEKEKIVLFPGGENGKTAFLSIIKNIFRNFKKHSSPKSITINEDEETEEKFDYYKLDISLSDADNNLKDDYFKVTLIEKSFGYNEEKINEKIDEISKHLIREPIIQNDGSVKNNGWGLLEMRICAAYLIGLPLDEFIYVEGQELYKDDFRTYPMKFIYVDKVSISEKYHLRHNFYLRKPKTATIWIENEQDIEQNKKKKLKEVGFIIKVKEENEKNGINNTNYSSPSQFVIGNHKYDKTAKHFNFRVLSNKHCFNYNNAKELKIDIKDKWIKDNEFSVDKLIYSNKDKEISYWLDNNSFTNSGNFEKPKALIDNHCEYYKSLEGNVETKIKVIKQQYDYYEKASYKNAYNNGLKDSDSFLKYETINTNIIIWDERIKEFLDENNDDDFGTPEISKRKVFGLKGITVPNFNLHKYFYADAVKNGNEKYDAITITEFKAQLKQDIESNDYIILHFSGFENIVGRSYKDDGTKYSINEAYEELKEEMEIGEYGNRENPASKYLIFTSGKGIPTTLPSSCYFIPYTTLKNLIETKPKLDLVSTLNSLRKINKK